MRMCWAVGLSFGMTMALNAQAVSGKKLVEAELLTDAADKTTPFTVAIRFIIEPGWYLYWRNPGDAGLAPEVQWRLPHGWGAGPLQFPVPSKFVHENTVAYGYRGELVLLATITPVGSEKGSVTANLDWLVCKESCLKGSAVVSLAENLTADRRADAHGRIEHTRTLLPESSVTCRVDHTDISGTPPNAIIAIALPESLSQTVVDFYPDIPDQGLIDYNSIRIRNNHILFKISHASGSLPNLISGLVVTQRRVYECSFAIDSNTRHSKEDFHDE